MVDVDEGRPAEPRAPHDGTTLRTLERGLHVLEILATSPTGMSFSEVIERVGLSTGTVNRLLQTLVRRGYVEQDRRAKTYRLGMQVLELQAANLASNRMAAEARPHLRNLMLRTDLRVHLAVYRGGDHLVYIDRVDNQESLGRFVPVGVGGAVHATSLGKAILAFSPPAVVNEFLDHSKRPKLTEKTITDVDALHRELDLVRARGYAMEVEESAIGTACVGAPVFDYTGQVVAAVSVAGEPEKITTNLASVAQHVTDAGILISQSFGARSGHARP